GITPATQPESKAAAVADPWHVLDAFEVGPEVYVRSLALDAKSNSVWVGTSTGVHEVDLASQNLQNTFTRAEGLANEYVFSIFVDREDGKWFGTNGGGASHYADGKWQVLFPMHGLADYWVYSFGQQADGGLWIGTWAGANYIPAGGGEIKTYLKELVNEWVYGIGVDSKQRVWFGTEGGVSMFDGQQWQAWTHKEGLGAANVSNLPISLNTGLGTRSRHDLNVAGDGQSTYNPSYVFCIHVDGKDTVWAGTWGGGVSYYDGKAWRSYTSKDGLAGDVVYSIAEGADGSLWFGTDRGVSRFDGKQWYSYGRQQGLLSDHVYAIVALPGNEVWVGSRGGVTRLGTAKVVEKPAEASSGKTDEM
ncbi:MAG: regulator, partial [Burkholderiales bacterium]|nr:regulator [Burkholderiales bacterium]